MWEAHKKGFRAYLQLERSLSGNSIDAYLGDVDKLTQYMMVTGDLREPGVVDLKMLQGFIRWVSSLGMTSSSQARIISGLRAFYAFCRMEQITMSDPTELLESPKLMRSLRKLLEEVHVAYLVDREGGWSARANWADVLSLGEQQRIAIIRLILHRPALAILDECTSAISESQQETFYRLLRSLKIAYVSVGHRPELFGFHDTVGLSASASVKSNT